MSYADQRLLGLVFIGWSVLVVLLVAIVHRLGVRRDQLDEAARRHPAGNQRPTLRIVR